ncbi:hypothetical protein GHT06_013763 [Daphnia sinensis]|uniref:Uncharacterized protein n=1 Tax=Daphnia sinensis TaxID=1820382 RepID=A0AAD5PUH9_9CRUS|nr:hypothetical protein GHT06_013763 [Daphnia sinensis]
MITATCHLFESSLTFQMVTDESKCQDVLDMTITTKVSQKRTYVTDYCNLLKKKPVTSLC